MLSRCPDGLGEERPRHWLARMGRSRELEFFMDISGLTTFFTAILDAAVKIVVDQSLLELKSKDTVPLDKVRNWTFAEQAQRDVANARLAR